MDRGQSSSTTHSSERSYFRENANNIDLPKKGLTLVALLVGVSGPADGALADSAVEHGLALGLPATG